VAAKDAARRVLLVDDHPVVRDGLRLIIESQDDLMVCGEADSARAARLAIKELHPDVVVTDLGLRQGDGMELVRDVRAQHPELPILVLSMHDEAIYAERVLAVGANGYVMKHVAGQEFLVAVRRVLEGRIYVSDAVGSSVIQRLVTKTERASRSPIDDLSNRELQVLQMMGKGLTTREIASALNLSGKTVESHRQRLKRKLNLQTGAQLVRYAVTWIASGGRAEPNPARGETPGEDPAT
jgi:DNA-binding NarL/FixJ family response regulator